MNKEVNFVDILKPRKTQNDIFSFVTRSFNPQPSHVLEKKLTPQDLKDVVAKSVYLDTVIEAESGRTGVHREKLYREILNYLEEMGLDKKMYVVRWTGAFFLKITFMMKINLYVNEPAVLKLKATMGKNPVLFLPAHRSYADFCLLTYLCFHYDIELPAVAAGMDFYSMAVVGRCMRETSAFYIRRTLVGAPLYAATLKQYVRTLVSKYYAPVEFFLEGTRSRSNKSLPPKYGILSMSLLPYFSREVTDITIIPVNISYDRLMEHSLFAYEHLGVPKPKESTGGFIKSLRSLNDNFGSIYINFGDTLSLKEFLGDDLLSSESLKPNDLQQLTPEQFMKVQKVAEYVISLQQKSTVATISNFISLVLMQSIMANEPLVLEDVINDVKWMMDILRGLGALVFEDDVRGSVEKILVVHSKMMRLDREGKLRLVSGVFMDLSNDVIKKMKGHILEAETMVAAVPIVQLQLYVNPILHYLIPPAIVFIVVSKGPVTKDKLSSNYHYLRKLLLHEFFHLEEFEATTFITALNYCLRNNVIAYRNESYTVGDEKKIQYLLKWSVWPALTTLLKCAEIMIKEIECTHRKALKLIQQKAESDGCHPYSLSLEAIANCLQGLVAAGALTKDRQEEVIYSLVPATMDQCLHLIKSVLPIFNVDFGKSNKVILDQRLPCRL